MPFHPFISYGREPLVFLLSHPAALATQRWGLSEPRKKRNVCVPMFLFSLVTAACFLSGSSRRYLVQRVSQLRLAPSCRAPALLLPSGTRSETGSECPLWRHGDRQSTVLSSAPPLPLRVLLSPEAQGAPATSQKPSFDAQRGRASIQPEASGLPSRVLPPQSWKQCGELPPAPAQP